jgi:protocatechuate 3,4-dioxygenase beta subunit
MKKLLMGAGVFAVAGLALWLWLGGSETQPGAPVSESALAARSADAVRQPVNALLESPLPQPKGSLAIRGKVVGPSGPVSGAVVVATGDGGEDVLSDLDCQCDNKCGRRLLECGCPQAAAQLVELVLERRGEAPPVARATTGPDGTFAIEGLEEGSFTLWAEKPGQLIGVQRHLSAGVENAQVTVGPGLVLRGKVTDDQEKPVSSALVTAIFAEHSRFFDAASAADGTFSIGPVPFGKYSLVASKGDLLPGHARAEDGGAVDALRLFSPRRVTGRVLDGAAPLKGATVRLEGGHRKLKVETDAQGLFSFEGLRPLSYELSATNGLRLAAREVSIAPGKDVLGIELILDEAGEIIGSVRGSGGPLAEAEVEARGSDRHDSESSAKSGADGRFRVGPLPAGKYRVRAGAEGYLSADWRDVEVARGGTASTEFTLTPAALVTGSVVDPEGNPIEQARVEARWTGLKHDGIESNRFTSAPSRRDGSFTLDGLLPGSYEVSVEHKDFRRVARTLNAPGSGERFALERGLALEGVVVDEADRPQAGVNISARLDKGGGKPDRQRDFREERNQGVRTATSLADGTFTLKGLEAGRYEIEATTSGEWRSGKTVRTAHAQAEVRPGASSKVRLQFARGEKISGVVERSDGKPVEGARVFAYRDDDGELGPGSRGMAMSAADGTFAVEHLTAGSYFLFASKDGESRSERAEAKTGEEGVKLVLAKAPMIRGRVVRENGTPIKHFKINQRELVDAEDGRFELQLRARDGQARLIVEAEGLAATSRYYPVSENKDVEAGDIVLVAGRTVRGAVFDARTGAPIEGALVDVGDPDGKNLDQMMLAEEYGAVRTASDGTFALPQVDHTRRLLIAAQHEAYRLTYQPLASTEERVTLRMRRGASVVGSVRDADGKPLTASVMIEIGTEHREGRTEADGAFRIGGLPAGTGHAMVYARGPDRDQFRPQEFQLAEEGEARVDFRPQTGGARLTLRNPERGRYRFVLVPGDVPVPTKIEEMSALRSGFAGRTAGEVTQFEHVPPGGYSLFGFDMANRKALRLFKQLLQVSAEPEQPIEARVPEKLTEIATQKD